MKRSNPLPSPRLPALILGVSALVSLAGCGELVERELAEASVGSALSTAEGTKMTRDYFQRRPERPSDCVTAEDAAREVAERPQVGLYPQGCVDKAADGADVHAEYDSCTGPFGRVELRGGIDAHFEELGCDELSATIEDSGDLTGNDNAIDYSADALVRVENELRYVDFGAHWSFDTDRGRHVEAESDLDVVIDATTDCFTVAGNAHGTADEWSLSADYADFVVCPETCPESGTVDIVAEGPRREWVLQVVFDGSDVATVTAEDGSVYEVDMVCPPAQ